MENKKNDSALVRSSAAEYLTFVASTGEDKDSIEMRYEDENIWLTQKMMAALYDVSVAAINQHLKKIFEDGELQEEAVIKKYLITATDGKKYNTNDESLVLNSYLRYCYELKPWKASVGGTIPRLYNDNIAKAVIAVPSIEEQKRIVSILERFDKICTDMTAGLPAEIESRQKQYEYYRDKLLSF